MTADRTVVRELFMRFFPAPSWAAWRAAITALFGLAPTSDEEAAIIRRCTGRSALPTEPAREVLALCGRRGGKSLFAAFVAVWFACCRSYRGLLAPGERGVVMIIAANRRQARVVKGYVSGLIHAVPTLEALVVRETQEALVLSNGITIEIHTASYRAIRGYTVVAAICDEICFWPTDDAANPDTEILNALRPAMATVADAMLLCISSPYARRGEAWNFYSRYFGKDDAPVLVWQADTRTMNPTVPESVVADAYDRDEAVAAAEYGAQFRRDLERLFSPDALSAVVIPGRYELPAIAGGRYIAFVDPSGGSADSMTLAVAHAERERAVLDVLREVRPPFSPERVVEEFATVLRSYGLSTLVGDRYGGEWPRERFQVQHVFYTPAERTKSDLYLALLAMVNSGQVELLDHPRLSSQLGGLERRTGRSGRDTIDHAPASHDDVANAAAGALVLAGPRLIEAVGILRPPEPHFRPPLMFERPWWGSRSGSRLHRPLSRWGGVSRHADDQ